MADGLFSGQRLSYSGALCTVKYIGPVSGTKGDWLGIEWDDPNRGKHNGSHNGIKYFDSSQQGQSKSPTAASFVRLTRPTDKPLSFLEALKQKYAPEDSHGNLSADIPIQISGKTVQEVGFEKIRQQLAELHELRIAILDGLCIAGIEARPWKGPQELQLQEWQRIQEQHLKIVELDLSRNLLEKWADVVGICAALKSLRSLKVDGNRFRDLSVQAFPQWHQPFQNVQELSLNDTLLSWDEIVLLTATFPRLTHLSVSSNFLSSLTASLPTANLTHLNLTSNSLPSLFSLSPLTHLPNLQTLILRSNPLLLTPTTRSPFPHLITLDLSYTLLPNPQTLSPLASTFPKLKALLTNHTPLSHTPSSSLLTIARLPTLTHLNHSPITAPERQNAELFYLNLIARELSAAPPDQESQILSAHPRYHDLCALHGSPEIVRHAAHEVKKGTMAERIVNFTFYLLPAGSPADETVEKSAEIPRTVSVYKVKGVVGRLFGLRPLSYRLIFETGEWDPVGGEEGDEWSCSESDNDADEAAFIGGESGKGADDGEEPNRGKWVRREVELVDSTREVGFWVEGMEARVRVEPR